MYVRHYFVAISLTLLLLSIVAFSDNLFTDIHQDSNRDPKFVVHGIFWLAWFSLFFVQSKLIGSGNRALHRKLGIATALVGLGVLISTVYVFAAVFTSWREMPYFVKANRFLMTGFTILVVAALVKRGTPALHKRFMLLANLYILQPIIDRVAGHLDFETLIFSPVLWNLLFGSMFYYDYLTLRRIHPVTWIGFVVFWLLWAAAAAL
ncbi:MAG: hypothetical protein KF785_11800 [Gemmatimonadales bacterium]|nr:hypothetical protein [Gemmatimonadales bacterium]